MMAGENRKDGDWRSWSLIVILFAVGVWPVALFLLFRKLFGEDAKNRQNVVSAPPPLEVDPGPQQTQGGGQSTAMQTAADRSAQRTEHRAHRATTYRAPESRARAAAQSVVRSPAVKKSNARALKIIGLIVMAVGLLSAASPADMVFSGYVANWIGDLLKYLAIAVGGLGMFCGGLRMDANMRRYARYLAVLGETQAVPVSELSRKLGWPERQVIRDLEKMIDKGYFGERAYLDQGLGYFFRSSEADEKLRREQESTQQKPPKEAEEGYSGILRNIRRANDAIADPVLSAKIDRLEDITARIFRAVEEDPAKRSRIDKFLNYYLPTTQKLLDSYAEFEAAGVEGENLRQAKQRIEKTMDSIVAGFEHQLDELYKSDAMDVDSDIRVMETMLHRDTASVEEDFGLGGGTAVQGEEE